MKRRVEWYAEAIDPRGWAGFRAQTIARSTGTVVALLNSNEASLDEGDGETAWSLICSGPSSARRHNGVCGWPTRKAAESFLAHPEEWCEECLLEAEAEVAE